MQLDLFYVSEWGIISQQGIQGEKAMAAPNWMVFLNENQRFEDGLKFQLKPQPEDANQEYRVFFVLQELDEIDPLSEIFEFKVEVNEP